MIVEPIRSKKKKHKGVIFLRKKDTHGYFICKVYPVKGSEEIANKIIEALKEEGEK